jgi:hypothetical protein
MIGILEENSIDWSLGPCIEMIPSLNFPDNPTGGSTNGDAAVACPLPIGTSYKGLGSGPWATGERATDPPIQTVKIDNRTYHFGGLTRPFLVDEQFRTFPIGIRPPNTAPSVSVGGGATVQVCYFSFYDEFTGEYSSLGPGTTVTGNTTRVWSAFPTDDQQLYQTWYSGYKVVGLDPYRFFQPATVGIDCNEAVRTGDFCKFGGVWYVVGDIVYSHPYINMNGMPAFRFQDANPGLVGQTLYFERYRPRPRATHVVLWVGVNGAVPREVFKIKLGSTAAYTEATPTLSLGQVSFDAFEIMPEGTMGCFWNDRLVVAGGPDPTRVYLSELFYPERYGGLNFPTKNSEIVTGLFPIRDYLIITTPNGFHVLTGYTEDDMVLRLHTAGIGCAGPRLGYVADGDLYVANQRGVFLFNGALHNVLKARDSEWSTQVALTPSDYATFDPKYQTIKFVTGRMPLNYPVNFVSPLTGFYDPGWQYKSKGVPARCWVLHYGNSAASAEVGQPEWTDDTAPVLGGESYIRTFGRADGEVYTYIEDPENPGTATFDYICRYTYGLAPEHGMVIETAWICLGDPSGSFTEGKQLVEVYPYVLAEDDGWTLECRGGDEYAWSVRYYQVTPGDLLQPSTTPGVSTAIATAKILSATDAEYFYDVATVCRIAPNPAIHGRGFSFKLSINPQRDARFIGLSAKFGPGIWSRAVAGYLEKPL